MAESKDLIVSAEAESVVQELNSGAAAALVGATGSSMRGVEVNATASYTAALTTLMARVDGDYNMLLEKILLDCGTSEKSIQDMQQADEDIATMFRMMSAPSQASGPAKTTGSNAGKAAW